MGFGEQLRQWRVRRGMSQMSLGFGAEVSTRHISFLETGRARPSREMVLRLGAALDLPLRERNELLVGAGFAPRFGERPLDDAGLAEALRALQLILSAHEPNPAFVIDRHWRIRLWNRTQAYMLRELAAPDGSPGGLSALDLVFEPGLMRERFENWEEIALAVLRRLRRQVARAGPGDELHEIHRRIMSLPGVGSLGLAGSLDAPPPILVPMLIRQDGVTFKWFSTLAVFGATGEVTLEELVIESFFPGDDATRELVQAIAGQTGARRGARRRRARGRR